MRMHRHVAWKAQKTLRRAEKTVVVRETPTVVSWFEPTNTEHIEAWLHYCKHGSWPEVLWDAVLWRLDFPMHWRTQIHQKLISAWVEHVLQRSVRGKVCAL